MNLDAKISDAKKAQWGHNNGDGSGGREGRSLGCECTFFSMSVPDCQLKMLGTMRELSSSMCMVVGVLSLKQLSKQTRCTGSMISLMLTSFGDSCKCGSSARIICSL
jgi:hypothetical protein